MIDAVKWLIVICIVVVSVIFAGYYYYISLPISMDEYLVKLQNSNTLAIVMDLRGAYDNHTRHDIMQCGIDFAGSLPFGDKEIYIYSLDNNDECIASYPDDSIAYLTVGECIKEMYNTDQTIHIKYADISSTTYYNDKLLITMTPDYQGGCGVSYG